MSVTRATLVLTLALVSVFSGCDAPLMEIQQTGGTSSYREVDVGGLDVPNRTSDVPPCVPQSTTCRDVTTAMRCSEAGVWQASTCAETQRCVDGACRSLRCTPQVLVVVDRSTSMGGYLPDVEEAVSEILDSTDRVAFGLLTYPLVGGCTVDQPTWLTPTRRWPDAPIGAEHSELMRALVDNWLGGGDTPTARTLEWIYENPERVWSQELGPRVVLLLTDGEDSCRCSTDMACLEDALTAATTALSAEQAVTTIVVGFRYSGRSQFLNAIAAHGGSEFTTYLPARTAGELGMALSRVIESVKGCGP